MILTPEERRLYADERWRRPFAYNWTVERLWAAYVALEIFEVDGLATIHLLLGKIEMMKTANNLAIARVQELEHLTAAFCDAPEDRMWHAADRTWWRREGGRLVRAETPSCVWTHDEHHDAWESDCGEMWQFSTGGPAENKVRFCHGCGRAVSAEEAA